LSRARRNGPKVPNPPYADIPDVVVASRLSDRVSLAGRPDNAHLPLVPEGLCHGVRLGADRTLCGLPVRDLNVFPGLSYTGSTFLRRCVECSTSSARTR
jgi:hypothetical protein